MTTPFDDLLPELPKKVALAARKCWEACKDSKAGDWMSHIHHEFWLERLMEPVENRIRFILLYKDPKERVQRLRRLRPFDTKKATPEWRQAWLAYCEALATKDKVWHACFADENSLWRAYDTAAFTSVKAEDSLQKTSFSPEMLAVHAKVCGCPWGKDKDIFGTYRAWGDCPQ